MSKYLTAKETLRLKTESYKAEFVRINAQIKELENRKKELIKLNVNAWVEYEAIAEENERRVYQYLQ